jgi:hypothetical protein
MSAVWDLLLSPAGLALYAGFWILKIVAGTWVLRRAVMLLPVRVQGWTTDRLSRLRLRGRTPPLG